MKTMTCKQLGGPCDFPLHGDTADGVIKAQDSHLKEMVAGGDEVHQGALKAMKGRWKNPIRSTTASLLDRVSALRLGGTLTQRSSG